MLKLQGKWRHTHNTKQLDVFQNMLMYTAVCTVKCDHSDIHGVKIHIKEPLTIEQVTLHAGSNLSCMVQGTLQ
jgi:hypothetical protein